MNDYFGVPSNVVSIARWPVCATCRRMYTGTKTIVPGWIKQKEFAGECRTCRGDQEIDEPPIYPAVTNFHLEHLHRVCRESSNHVPTNDRAALLIVERLITQSGLTKKTESTVNRLFYRNIHYNRRFV